RDAETAATSLEHKLKDQDGVRFRIPEDSDFPPSQSADDFAGTYLDLRGVGRGPREMVVEVTPGNGQLQLRYLGVSHRLVPSIFMGDIFDLEDQADTFSLVRFWRDGSGQIFGLSGLREQPFGPIAGRVGYSP